MLNRWGLPAAPYRVYMLKLGKRSPKPWSTAGCCSSKVASTSSAKAQETDAAEDVTDVGRKETIEVVGRCVSVELEQSVCGNGQME